jgi:hypothetical protein
MTVPPGWYAPGDNMQKRWWDGASWSDPAAMESFGRNRQDPADRGSVLGMVVGGVGEQRMHRRQAGVAGGDAVAAFGLEVGEEPGDQVGVESYEPCPTRARPRRSRAPAGCCSNGLFAVEGVVGVGASVPG